MAKIEFARDVCVNTHVFTTDEINRNELKYFFHTKIVTKIIFIIFITNC